MGAIPITIPTTSRPTCDHTKIRFRPYLHSYHTQYREGGGEGAPPSPSPRPADPPAITPRSASGRTCTVITHTIMKGEEGRGHLHHHPHHQQTHLRSHQDPLPALSAQLSHTMYGGEGGHPNHHPHHQHSHLRLHQDLLPTIPAQLSHTL